MTASKMLKALTKPFPMVLVSSVLILSLIFGTDSLVRNSAKRNSYSDSNQTPKNKVGLLLGTGKFLNSGHVNLYYKYRIDAAIELYKSGKVNFILVSGDNSRSNYDEPSTMKEDLISRGIPAQKIVLDYAGFRTLDSIVRCKAIFRQTDITIISQKFHTERALFIAKRKGINAIAFNAKDVSKRYGIKVQIRERLARVKTILDLTFGKKARFLGDTIEIK